MKYSKRVRWVVIAAMAALLLAFAPSADVGRATGEDPTLPTESELTAKWWRWVYSLPVSVNPLFDETGANAGNGQPFQGSKVFFLCGVFNVSGTATREITVPAGTAFFFPLLNVEWDNVGIPPTSPDYLTVPELYAFVEWVMSTADEDDLHVTLNGVDLLPHVHRVQSAPFAYQLPKKDSLVEFFFDGLKVPVVAPAVSDGYWLYIPPLAKGVYTLNSGGTFGDPINFTLDITYTITVE